MSIIIKQSSTPLCYRSCGITDSVVVVVSNWVGRRLPDVIDIISVWGKLHLFMLNPVQCNLSSWPDCCPPGCHQKILTLDLWALCPENKGRQNDNWSSLDQRARTEPGYTGRTASRCCVYYKRSFVLCTILWAIQMWQYCKRFLWRSSL